MTAPKCPLTQAIAAIISGPYDSAMRMAERIVREMDRRFEPKKPKRLGVVISQETKRRKISLEKLEEFQRWLYENFVTDPAQPIYMPSAQPGYRETKTCTGSLDPFSEKTTVPLTRAQERERWTGVPHVELPPAKDPDVSGCGALQWGRVFGEGSQLMEDDKEREIYFTVNPVADHYDKPPPDLLDALIDWIFAKIRWRTRK